MNGETWATRSPLAMSMALGYLVWATFVITNGDFLLFGPEKLGLVYNDMARRMLSWDFTSSPEIIQFEAFVRDGRTYAYYGIFPALLRIPMVIAGLDTLQVGRISCLVALTITVYAYVRLYQVMLEGLVGRGSLVAWTAVLSLAATGPQVYLLASASLYHEIIFWSAALTALFLLVVISRWVRGQPFSTLDLFVLVTLAGFCLLCRLPAGISLYVALLLLLIRECVQGLRAVKPGMWLPTVVTMPAWLRRVLIIGMFSLTFVAVQGFVNYERWGNPLITSPYMLYGQFLADPASLARVDRHGLFSWVRVGLATIYYSTGLKLEAVVPAMFEEYYGGIEGPRALVPLTSPVLMALMLVGILSFRRRPSADSVPVLLAIASLAGLLLVLGFFALCLRYTFDAWGLVVLLSAVGLRDLAARPRLPRIAGIGSLVLLIGGIAVSQATLLRYKIVYSGTDPVIRYALSKELQPIICPNARLNTEVKLTDFNPLVTPNCPPLW